MRRVIFGAVILLFLVWAWPNLVHEPLHWFALEVQGSSGVISFDFGHVLAHPSITRTAPVRGVVGGLFYVLAPSLFSIAVLIALWLTRRTPGFLSHIVLPVFLVMDLILNIWHYGSPESDFHFLVAVPHAVSVVSAAVVLVAGGFLIAGLWRCMYGVGGEVRGSVRQA